MKLEEFLSLLESKGLSGEAGTEFLNAPDDVIRAKVDEAAAMLAKAVSDPCLDRRPNRRTIATITRAE